MLLRLFGKNNEKIRIIIVIKVYLELPFSLLYKIPWNNLTVIEINQISFSHIQSISSMYAYGTISNLPNKRISIDHHRSCLKYLYIKWQTLT